MMTPTEESAGPAGTAGPEFTGVTDRDHRDHRDLEINMPKEAKEGQEKVEKDEKTPDLENTPELPPRRIMLLVMLSMFQGYASMVGPLQSAYKHELGISHGTDAGTCIHASCCGCSLREIDSTTGAQCGFRMSQSMGTRGDRYDLYVHRGAHSTSSGLYLGLALGGQRFHCIHALRPRPRHF